jgi:hypothetical protein
MALPRRLCRINLKLASGLPCRIQPPLDNVVAITRCSVRIPISPPWSLLTGKASQAIFHQQYSTDHTITSYHIPSTSSRSFGVTFEPNITTMSRDEKHDLPPSYSETPVFSPSSNTNRGQQILDQLTLARTHHIRTVIETHVIPLVEQQAAYGIAQTVIAMIPSDIPLPPVAEKSEFSFDTDSKPVEVVGFPADQEPKIVRLEGHMNRTEFWRPEAIVVELERALRETLSTNAHLNLAGAVQTGSEPEPRQQSRQNFLSKMVGSKRREGKTSSADSNIGAGQLPGGGSLLVAARLEVLSLRTLSEFGLYDTMARQCIIIKVDARG